MDVYELFELTKWIRAYLTPLNAANYELQRVLKVNASGQPQEAVDPHLDKLIELLNAMPMDQLSNAQLALLSHWKIESLIGKQGVHEIEKIKSKSNYDVVTAATRNQENLTLIENALQMSDSLNESLEHQHEFISSYVPHPNSFIIRVHFKKQTSITDVVKLKEWSADWYDIARNLAFCFDEPPEDVKLIGAANGSLILIFATGAYVALTIAAIIEKFASIALDVAKIRLYEEKIKQEKIYSNYIEDAFQKTEDQIVADRSPEILEEAKKKISEKTKSKDIATDKAKALKISVQKITKFNNGGGEIEVQSPLLYKDDGEQETNDLIESARYINKALKDTRLMHEEIKLLEHRMQTDKTQ